jgi:hypothetical protein
MPMDFLRVLKAAGLIDAEMIEAVDGDPDTACAVVTRITPEARRRSPKRSSPGSRTRPVRPPVELPSVNLPATHCSAHHDGCCEKNAGNQC